MKNKRKKPNDNKYTVILIYALVIIAAILGVAAYFIIQNKDKKEDIAYTQFIKDIDEGKVEEIEMTVRKHYLKSNI